MLRPEAQEQGDLAQGRSARPATSPSRRGAVGMVSGCRVSVQRGVRTTCAVRGREGAAGMKILFLDIDGVIFSGRALWATGDNRSEEHTSELQSLMRISYAVFCLKKKKI